MRWVLLAVILVSCGTIEPIPDFRTSPEGWEESKILDYEPIGKQCALTATTHLRHTERIEPTSTKVFYLSNEFRSRNRNAPPVRIVELKARSGTIDVTYLYGCRATNDVGAVTLTGMQRI